MSVDCCNALLIATGMVMRDKTEVQYMYGVRSTVE